MACTLRTKQGLQTEEVTLTKAAVAKILTSWKRLNSFSTFGSLLEKNRTGSKQYFQAKLAPPAVQCYIISAKTEFNTYNRHIKELFFLKIQSLFILS